MYGKIIVTVVAALLVATAIIGIVSVNNSDDDTDDVIDFEGKWVLTYYEMVDLVDENHKPVLNAKDCRTYADHYNPKTSPLTMELKSSGKYFFIGKMNETAIFGTRNGNLLEFEEGITDGSTHIFAGKALMHDKYLSLAFYQLDREYEARQMCCAGYALFMPENGEQPYPYSDRVDYNLPYERVSAIRHDMSDFVHGDGHGTPLEDANMAYAKSHTLLNLFDITGDNGVCGVEALISLGKDQGAAKGVVVGNASPYGENVAFSGQSVMAAQKLFIKNTLYSDSDMSFVQMEFNVPYESGTIPGITQLERNYEGTVTIWDKLENSSTFDIVKMFKTNVNVVYGYEKFDNVTYEWFGIIDGTTLIMSVVSENVHGRIFGLVFEDGRIELNGMLYTKSGELSMYQYVLYPIK